MKSIQRRKSNPRPQKAARWHSSGFGRRKRLDFWKCCLTYSGLTEKIEYMKIDILWFCSLFLLNKVFMLTWLMLIGGRDSQVLNLSQHQKIQWIKRTGHGSPFGFLCIDTIMLEFWCSDFPIFPVLFGTPQTERWETSTLLSCSISESNACRKAWFSHVFPHLSGEGC